MPRKDEEKITLNYANIEHETDAAWLIELTDGVQYWFPFSQCSIDEKKKTVTTPKWLLKRKQNSSPTKTRAEPVDFSDVILAVNDAVGELTKVIEKATLDVVKAIKEWES